MASSCVSALPADLSAVAYRGLQQLAKARGLRANLKREALVAALLSHAQEEQQQEQQQEQETQAEEAPVKETETETETEGAETEETGLAVCLTPAEPAKGEAEAAVVVVDVDVEHEAAAEEEVLSPRMREQQELSTLVAQTDYLEWTPTGRVVCTITDHELPANLRMVAEHVQGKRMCRLLRALTAEEARRLHLERWEEGKDAAEAEAEAGMPLLRCMLTGVAVKNNRVAVDKHVASQVYQRALQRFKETGTMHPGAEQQADAEAEEAETQEKKEEGKLSEPREPLATALRGMPTPKGKRTTFASPLQQRQGNNVTVAWTYEEMEELEKERERAQRFEAAEDTKAQENAHPVL